MALDNFQAQVANLYDIREQDLNDPLGYRDRNAAYSSTTISVFEAGTTTPVTTFPTDDKTGAANPHPFNVDNEGSFIFYAQSGIRVDVVVNYVEFSPDNRGWYDVLIGSDFSTINDRLDGIDDDIDNINQDLAEVPTKELVDETIEDALTDYGGDLRNYQEDLVNSINDILIRNEEDLNLKTENSVLRTEIFRLESSLEDNLAAITRIDRTLVDSEQALAENLTLIQAKLNNNEARIVTNQQAIVEESQSRVTSFEGLNVRMGAAEANITDTQTAIVTETEARTSAIQQLEASLGETNASVTTVQQAIVTESETRATQVSQLQATDNNIISQINQVTSDVDGNAQAISGLQGTVNDNVTGLSATYNIANRAELKADGNASSITTLSNRVTDTENEATSALNLATTIDSSLNTLRATASLSVSANGRVGLVQLDATPTLSSVVFRGDELIVQDNAGSDRLFFNSSTGRLNIEGDLIAAGGTFSGDISTTRFANMGALDAESGAVITATITNTNTTQNNIALNAVNLGNGASIVATTNGNRGVASTANVESFYANIGGYGPFTGSHEALIPKNLVIEPGDIICDDELFHIANISNAIGTAYVPNKAFDERVRGVYIANKPLRAYQKPASLIDRLDVRKIAKKYNLISFNAVGEGVMNVCGQNGNIEPNECICSSDMKGKGMGQKTKIANGATVAINRFPVKFDNPRQVKQVAVIYVKG